MWGLLLMLLCDYSWIPCPPYFGNHITTYHLNLASLLINIHREADEISILYLTVSIANVWLQNY
jgi:hypothetical protein